MKILHTIKELRDFRNSIGIESVGLVPTMGALHKGHLSLMAKSCAQNTQTIVSIFVNPKQFGQNEDFSTYPRSLEQDLLLCENVGVSAVFAPSVQEIYSSNDEVMLLPPKKMGYILEGFDRPTHFAGVLQIVLKLFCIIQPHRAYFGKKDAQQALILQKMIQNLHLPIELVFCPIIRDDDGLAFSSRNVYLSPKERAQALCIPRAIQHIESAIAQGVYDTRELQSIAEEILSPIQVFYTYFCDYELAPIAHIAKGQSLFLIAAKVGHTRLLDNLWC